MHHSYIEPLRKKLESQRKEAIQLLNQLGREARSLQPDPGQDSGDLCIASLSRESLFEQTSQRRTILRLIEAALHRIHDGSFGICVACDEEIQIRRLQAVPWTQFCLRCQEEIEREVGSSLSSRTSSLAPSTEWKRAG